jgi:hypothetical protein
MPRSYPAPLCRTFRSLLPLTTSRLWASGSGSPEDRSRLLAMTVTAGAWAKEKQVPLGKHALQQCSAPSA